MEADSVGERLVRAVQDHRVVELVYHGHQRTVEPHMVALHGAGEPVLFAYQTFPSPRGDFAPSASDLVEVFARA
jgi:hypothetical protein